VIRTIRDKVGENPGLFYHPKIIEKVVEEYNNTPHSAFSNEFTPKEVQMHKDLEEIYIRENMKRLEEVKVMQEEAGFFLYKPGNILLVHVDNAKNERMLKKKRRVFNHLAVFIEYDHGNVVCQVLMKTDVLKTFEKPITIPTYFTKYLAPSFNRVPKQFLSLVF
jgi:choline kinase